MGIKGRSSHDPGRFVSNSVAVTSLSKQASIQTIIQIMNILSVFVLFAILLKCVAASEDTFGVEFREAVDGENFEWLRENWRIWKERKDLFDYVIAKGADVTVRLIQNVDSAKRHVLAALFDKGEGMIDDVLGGIRYDDDDLRDLTGYRHELAGSPEKFFRVLDKIKEPKNARDGCSSGVSNLFEAGRHDLVVPLVNALGKRTFKSNSLKDVAIQMAFCEGAKRGNQDIVELYYEHPAITSGEYAVGLYASWNYGKPNQVFQFLLEQADQGDLDMAKKKYAMRCYEKFRQAIDKAPEPTPPAGSRHSRFSEKTEAIEETSTDTVPLITFPKPLEVAFDDKGVPILNGMDPTKVPIAGLSILERVERAKRMREERQKKGTET